MVLALLLALLAPADSKYDEWLEKEAVYIISSREKKDFKALTTDEERELFIEDFWKRRDPVAATAINEFKEEHYRRIEYANDRFGTEGKPGWKTVRGQTYILHGPPDDIHYAYGYLQSVTVNNPTTILWPEGGVIPPIVYVEVPTPESETWVYRYLPGANSSRTYFTVIFAKMDPMRLYDIHDLVSRAGMSRASLSGESSGDFRRVLRDRMIKEFVTRKDYFRNDFRIVYAGSPRYYDLEEVINAVFRPNLKSDGLDQFSVNEGTADLLRSTGEIFEDLWDRKRKMEELVSSRIYFGTLDLRVGYAFLRQPRDQVAIPLIASISLPPGSTPPSQIDLLVDLMDTQSGKMVAQLQDAIEFQKNHPPSYPIQYQSRLSAPSGAYRLRVVASDLSNQLIGTWEENIEVPSLVIDGFQASELLLCEEVVKQEVFDAADDKKGRGWVSSFGRENPLAFDENIFVPAISPKFRRGQNLTTLVEVYNPTLVEERPDVQVQTFLMRDGKSVFSTPAKSLDYVSKGEGSRILYAFSLPLQRLDFGEYEMVVRLTDGPTGKAVQRQTRIQIF